ncbi:MAG: Crp/Fnr family transcriptional regulator [Acidobacteria bacterium]|nr:Crp/Fnr family transcriptional regulator [Acidobacteriota bacterium]
MVRLLRNVEPVSLVQNDVLYERGARIRYVFFLEQSVVSLLATLSDGTNVEVAVLGSRGFLGVPLALGGQSSQHMAIVQIAGNALRMKAETFLTEFERGGIFRKLLLNYSQSLILTISETAVCNDRHPLDKRLARLLLTIHDEFGSAEFPTTDQFLSGTLIAAPAEIANAAALFHRDRLIDYTGGTVRILDRRGLEANACQCYRKLNRACDSVLIQ